MIAAAFNQTNSVSIYQILSSETNGRWLRLKRQTRDIFVIYTIGAVIVFVLFSHYSYFVAPVFIFLASFLFIRHFRIFPVYIFFYINYLFYYDRTKDLMFITFSCSVLHLGLSMLFTRYSLYYTCLLYVFLKALMVAMVVFRAKGLINKYVR